MKLDKISNTKLKDILKYCDNNLCKNCPYQTICISKVSGGKEYTFFSILSNNVEELKDESNK